MGLFYVNGCSEMQPGFVNPSDSVTCQRRCFAIIMGIVGIWTFWTVYGTYGIGLTIGTLIYLCGLCFGLICKSLGVFVKIVGVILSCVLSVIPACFKYELLQALYQVWVGLLGGIAHVFSGLASALSVAL